MDSRYIFLLLAFAAVVIILGGYDPARDREREKYMRDPLAYSIEKELKNKGGKGSAGFFTQGNFTQQPGTTGAYGNPPGGGAGVARQAPANAGAGNADARGGAMTRFDSQGNFMPPAQNAAPSGPRRDFSQGSLFGVRNPSAEVAPGQYPAPYTGAGQGAAQPAATSSGAPEYYLQDGRRIFFSGAQVMELRADGTLAPLEDGSYPLHGGGQIVIEGGVRVE